VTGLDWLYLGAIVGAAAAIILGISWAETHQ
jgi:hypothetical protein